MKSESEIVDALILDIKSVIEFLTRYGDGQFTNSLTKIIDELKQDAVRNLPKLIGWTKNAQNIKEYFDSKMHQILDSELELANAELLLRMKSLHEKCDQARLDILIWFAKYRVAQPNEEVQNFSADFGPIIKEFEELYRIAIEDQYPSEIEYCERILDSLRKSENRYVFEVYRNPDYRSWDVEVDSTYEFQIRLEYIYLTSYKIGYAIRLKECQDIWGKLEEYLDENTIYNVVGLNNFILKFMADIAIGDIYSYKYFELLTTIDSHLEFLFKFRNANASNALSRIIYRLLQINEAIDIFLQSDFHQSPYSAGEFLRCLK